MDTSAAHVPTVPRTKIDAASNILAPIRIRDVHRYTTTERAANGMANANIGSN
jgi:hypothetical protein